MTTPPQFEIIHGEIRALTDDECVNADGTPRWGTPYRYVVAREFVYREVAGDDDELSESGDPPAPRRTLTVPVGFLTDGASGGAPDIGRSWLFHDWMYATHCWGADAPGGAMADDELSTDSVLVSEDGETTEVHSGGELRDDTTRTGAATAHSDNVDGADDEASTTAVGGSPRFARGPPATRLEADRLMRDILSQEEKQAISGLSKFTFGCFGSLYWWARGSWLFAWAFAEAWRTSGARGPEFL